MAGCFHWHALGWGFPIPVQLQCFNSEGSWEDPVTWSDGERDDGRNHLFAELSLFTSNFFTNLHGRTLRLARLKELQSTLHWSVFMGFLQTPEQAKLSPDSEACLHCCIYLYLLMHPGGVLWCLDRMVEVDPCPVPWLRAWFSQHPLTQAVGQL